jgi:hypothetical protein
MVQRKKACEGTLCHIFASEMKLEGSSKGNSNRNVSSIIKIRGSDHSMLGKTRLCTFIGRKGEVNADAYAHPNPLLIPPTQTA